MLAHRGGLMYLALLVAESAWVYVISGVTGIVLGMPSAVLPWAAIFGTLAIAMFSSWILGGLRGRTATLAMIQGAVALAGVYIVVGARPFDGRSGVDVAWLPRVLHGDLSDIALSGAVAASLLAIFLWRRAASLLSGEPVETRLQGTFRLGLGVVAVALLIEVASGEQAGARQVLFPFFAASLAGMALGKLAEPERVGGARIWTRVVAGTVGIVLLFGLLFGILSGVYGGGALRLLGSAWGGFVDGALWLLQWPLRYVIGAIVWFIEWLRSLLKSEEERPQLNIAPGGFQFDLPEEVADTGPGLVDQIIDIIQWPLFFILLVLMFLVLSLAFRRLRKRLVRDQDADRESIRGDADVGKDLAGLLGKLLPRWNRNRAQPLTWHYPLGQPGISEVFQLYFEYLGEAIRRGMVLNPRLTPNERAPDLEMALPGAPISLMTRRFNAACYGRQPSPPGVVAMLEADLVRLRELPLPSPTPAA